MLDHLSHLPGLSDIPRHNIKSVVQQTHVNISTLRAWEQRYGIPQPDRSNHGHRLYSQRDIAVIKWLKQCTDKGLIISQAVQMLRESQLMEDFPGVKSPAAPVLESMTFNWADLRIRLLESLLTVNLRNAHMLVNMVSSMYPLDTLIAELFQPLMVLVGEYWERGQLSIGEEHLITHFVRQRLMGFSQLFMPYAHGPRLVCCCAPHDQHELGLLMFATLMEQRGWEVIYLGANMSADGLRRVLCHVTPAVLCVSFSMAEHVPGFFEITHALQHFDPHQIAFTYAGRAFVQNPELHSKLPGTFLGYTLHEAAQNIGPIAQEIDHERWLILSRN